MIERLSATNIPTHQRTTTNEGVSVNEIKDEEPISTNQFENKQPQTNDQIRKRVEDIVDGLNGFLKPAHTSIQFKFHEKLNEYYVTIVDDNTNEVIKEIPSKKLLDMYADMEEHLGLLVDKKI